MLRRVLQRQEVMGGGRDVPVGVQEIILAQTRACASRSSIQEVSGSGNNKTKQKPYVMLSPQSVLLADTLHPRRKWRFIPPTEHMMPLNISPQQLAHKSG